jgi:uncharacterized protein involved in type VI secretion and phage assembly
MIEEMLRGLVNPAEDEEGAPPRVAGVLTGRVINLVDPLGLGRIQVQLREIDGLDLSPWARLAAPMAGSSHGFYFVPNVHDEVLVAFEQGDVSVPYIIGSLWTTQAPPPLPSPLPQIRTIKTRAGNEITLTETPPAITIKTPSGQTVNMSTAVGVEITSGTTSIKMNAGGDPSIYITAGSHAISLTTDAVIVNSAADLTVSATGSLNLIGGQAVHIVGPQIDIG